MRADLAKVLVERPRRGGSGSYHRNPSFLKHRGRLFEEDAPPVSKLGMRRWHHDRKELNENLQPLYRLLRSWVGKSWDRFYSELSQVFDKRSTINAHIFQHLMRDVATTPLFIDGRYYITNVRYHGGLYPIEESTYEFYVDRFHVLRSTNYRPGWWPPRTKLVDLNSRTIGTREFRRLRGIWYEVTAFRTAEMMAMCPKKPSDANPYPDILTKRQLSKKDLRDFGLREVG